MANEPVFRFLALRQPRKKLPRGPQGFKGAKTLDFSVTGRVPPFVQQVSMMATPERTEENVTRAATRFRASDRYVDTLDDVPLDVRPLLEWAERNRHEAMKELAVAAFVEEAYLQTPAQLIASQRFIETADRLAESLFADSLFDADDDAPGRDDIGRAIKLLHLVRDAAANADSLKTDETLNDALGRSVVVLPDPKITRPAPEDPPMLPPVPEEGEETKKSRADLKRLAAARDEVLAALERPGALTAKPRPPAGGPDEITSAPSPATGARTTRARSLVLQPEIVFSRPVFEGLSAPTKEVFSAMKLDLAAVDPHEAVAALEKTIAREAAAVPEARVATKVLAFGGLTIDRDKFIKSRSHVKGNVDLASTKPQHRKFEAGVGDLLIVKQILKAYELGDFAHVENVMMGEVREREHRRLVVREETTVFESERETHTERDLQTTDRNEMMTEASKSVSTEFGLEAGTEVSYSYGGVLKMSANMNVSFSSEIEETQKKAVKISREVTDKLTEKLREKVRQERRLRILEQTEEINKHKFENTVEPKGHIRGIYRWLNKVYDAQVFNYGQRMMYEFVAPEPAAWFLWAMIENADDDLGIEKPEPPKIRITADGEEKVVPLKASHLTVDNYYAYLTKYGVTGVRTPPQAFTNVAWFANKDDDGENRDVHKASKVGIPDGYKATRVTVQTHGVFSVDEPMFVPLVGGLAVTDGWLEFGTQKTGELAVGLFAFGFKSYVTTFDIRCIRTTLALRQWQLETFDAIMEAYERLRSAYEEKLEQIEIQKGPLILGRNPLENRRIARDEIKKLVIMMFVGQPKIVTHNYVGEEPTLHLKNTLHTGPQIRFFENAFEWNNMTWSLYPYFWGRKAGWTDALKISDADPDFAAFLRAGAARVQVPVRPGFEKAVAYFAQTRKIWNGNDPPMIGDELYVSIIDEITENLGKLNENTPYSEESKPWEVTVPTTLVMVQDLSEIPAIKDSLTP